jgi:tetratricopeptide (TPR) repeat protein
MSKETQPTQDKFEGIENALSRAERYIEENRKSLTIIIAAIVLAVVLYLAFIKFYLQPKETRAQKQMFMAEQYFEKDSFKTALNGDGNYPGFLEIINNYGLTKSANLSRYYAGICYKNLGNYKEAIQYLKKFESDDKIISNIALGSIGDCYANLGDNKQALKYYKRAADNEKNDFTTPMYLMRAGILMEQMNDYQGALKNYQRIEKEYNRTYQEQQIEKYVERVKIKGNLK